jgi:hypothetical protein
VRALFLSALSDGSVYVMRVAKPLIAGDQGFSFS